MGKTKYAAPVNVTVRLLFYVRANNGFDAIKEVEALDMDRIFPQWRIVNVAIPQAEGIFLASKYAKA
jgi:hypothetical protein